ncbi:MAG: ATP synthase subunit I [bacterium]|nr:ATP synthase subunit I [bacterium]
MHRPGEAARIGRLRTWVLAVTLIPSVASAVAGHGRFAAGLAAGGLLVGLNLVGTQRTVLWMVEGQGIERITAVLVWFGKFGLTAAAILGLLYSHAVEPVALLIGLGSLPVSLVFDIFLFPVNKGEAKNP